MRSCEVVIVGAGVAGLVLAQSLSDRGFDVVLVEGVGPRPKMPRLGESLPPSAGPLLERLGLLEQVRRAPHRSSDGYQSVWGSGRLTRVDFRDQMGGPGYKIDKQALLVQMESGAEGYTRMDAELAGVEANFGGYRIRFTDRSSSIQTKFIVDATGRRAWWTRLRGAKRHRFDDLAAFVVNLPRREVPGVVTPVFIEAFAQGWGLVSRLDDHSDMVAVFSTRSSGALHECRSLAGWRRLCRDTRYFSMWPGEAWPETHAKVIGMDASSSIAPQLAGSNWLLVGDAAMTFDPLSSHGLTTAMYSALRATMAISETLEGDESATERYAKTMTSIYNSYLNELLARYRQEQRWPESLFWMAKQKFPTRATPVQILASRPAATPEPVEA